MREEEFVKAVDDADFDLLLGSKEKLYEFLKYVKEEVDEGARDVVVRCACEDAETLLPYFVWLVYKVSVDGEYVGLSFKQFYIPREDNLESYYMTPDTIDGRRFFSVVVE